MDLDAALRQFADQTGFSQRQLAEMAGVDQATISRAMTGNYGRDGWRAAMKILGLNQVIRRIDGSYSTPTIADLVEMLSKEIAQERETSSPNRIAEIRELQELVTGLQRSTG